MTKSFIASLCYEGAHGGGLFLTDDYIIFRTQKLQLPDHLKYIQISYFDIEDISSSNSLLIFPAITLRLKDSTKYKFIVFNRKKCLKLINEKITIENK